MSIISPQRGSIYDRNGTILATSIPRESIFYSSLKDEPLPEQFKKIESLRSILNLSPKELQSIEKRIERNEAFIWIRRKIEPALVEKIKKKEIKGIFFREENQRFYPQGKLAAHLIGRVNIDEAGQSGVEYRYNEVLQGKIGRCLILRDAKKRGYRLEVVNKPERGKDIYMTIDETIQYIAERELEKAVKESRANWGTVIISHPISGEILAMANCPSWDLNHSFPVPHLIDYNRAIHHAFDPGSTFKIVTASAAREFQRVGWEDKFDCSQGSIYVAGKTIRDHKKFGILEFPEVIIHSSNVGTIQVGQRVGENYLYQTIKAFGFGEKTGIDLPAEASGIFRPLKNWTKISLASLSIGYEISVTPIQLLQAINIIANKGILVPPIVVKMACDSPQVYDFKEEVWHRARRVISERTALEITSILQRVVEVGTGMAAKIEGYEVAGKTGTAQKLDESFQGYSSSLHTASFVGFVPVKNPLISMVVVIDSPQGKYYGGQVAAPLFREIASQVLRYMGIKEKREFLQAIIAAK